jgi:hypothetical protein
VGDALGSSSFVPDPGHCVHGVECRAGEAVTASARWRHRGVRRRTYGNRGEMSKSVGKGIALFLTEYG